MLGFTPQVAWYWERGAAVFFDPATFARTAYIVGIHRYAHSSKSVDMREFVRHPDEPSALSGEEHRRYPDVGFSQRYGVRLPVLSRTILVADDGHCHVCQADGLHH